MRKKINLLILILMMFGFLSAQNSDTLLAVADRQLYIVGENVSLFILFDSVSDDNDYILCDLQSADGVWIKGEKLRIKSSEFLYQFALPQEISTGIYFLRLYSTQPELIDQGIWTIIPLKIINPYSNQITPSNSADFIADSSNIKQFPFSEFQYYDSTKSAILLKNNYLDPHSKYIFSLVPSTEVQNIQFSTYEKPVLKKLNHGNNALNIRGKLVSESANGVGDRIVFLTIPQTGELLTSHTDSACCFNFSLRDYHSVNKIVITIDDSAQFIDYQIKIHSEFAAPMNISCSPFSLSKREKESGLAMAQNQQIKQAFEPKMGIEIPKNIPFYGLPDEVIIIDDFINLNRLDEYFTQLPFSARLKYDNQVPYFVISTDNPSMNQLKPLIMIDLIPIYHFQDLIKLNPLLIDRIEIVKDIYLIGSVKFGGIINIISRNGDFASLNFGNSAQIFEFIPMSKNEIPLHTNSIPQSQNTFLFETDSKFPNKIHIPETMHTSSIFKFAIRLTKVGKMELGPTEEIPFNLN